MNIAGNGTPMMRMLIADETGTVSGVAFGTIAEKVYKQVEVCIKIL